MHESLHPMPAGSMGMKRACYKQNAPPGSCFIPGGAKQMRVGPICVLFTQARWLGLSKRRRRNGPRPSNPVPSNSSEDGSGVAAASFEVTEKLKKGAKKLCPPIMTVGSVSPEQFGQRYVSPMRKPVTPESCGVSVSPKVVKNGEDTEIDIVQDDPTPKLVRPLQVPPGRKEKQALSEMSPEETAQPP